MIFLTTNALWPCGEIAERGLGVQRLRGNVHDRRVDAIGKHALDGGLLAISMAGLNEPIGVESTAPNVNCKEKLRN
jgi:hypothetical protein